MLLLDKPKTNQVEACVYDNTTLICGMIIEVDYFSFLESKMIDESFYGDIDLFGF